MLGRLHSIETFGAVDGPGIRYMIFLSGCPLRCKYCHNPDTWFDDENTQNVVASDLVEKSLRFKPFWKDEGGITVSGGEPLLQIDFLIELFKLAKEKGINTCIDTSCACFSRNEKFLNKFNELMKYTDLLLCDIKHINDEKHKELTGQSNKHILDMITYLSEINKPIWIRHVLVPTITDFDEYLIETRKFIDTLTNVKKIEILPYHTIGEQKWIKLNRPYPLHGLDIPSKERVENAKKILIHNIY